MNPSKKQGKEVKTAEILTDPKQKEEENPKVADSTLTKEKIARIVEKYPSTALCLSFYPLIHPVKDK